MLRRCLRVNLCEVALSLSAPIICDNTTNNNKNKAAIASATTATTNSQRGKSEIKKNGRSARVLCVSISLLLYFGGTDRVCALWGRDFEGNSRDVLR